MLRATINSHSRQSRASSYLLQVCQQQEQFYYYFFNFERNNVKVRNYFSIRDNLEKATRHHKDNDYYHHWNHHGNIIITCSPSMKCSFTINDKIIVYPTRICSRRFFGSRSDNEKIIGSNSIFTNLNETLDNEDDDDNDENDSSSVYDLIAKLEHEDQAMISLLMEYHNTYGDCHVPSGFSQANRNERELMNINPDLVQWIRKIRKKYANKQYDLKIRPNKKINDSFRILMTVLESIGFLWSDREAQWHRWYRRLMEHNNNNNNSASGKETQEYLVPKNDKTNKKEKQEDSETDLHRYTIATKGGNPISKKDNIQLWTWVGEQRRAFKANKLSDHRISLLKDIQFIFDPTEDWWQTNYEKLREFQKEHGHTLVPANYEKDPTLGSWVARQRFLHSRQKIMLHGQKTINSSNNESKEDHHFLSDERLQKLNSLDFSWDPFGDSWNHFYSRLCAFHAEHGHTRVPRENKSLFTWVERQRSRFNAKTRKLLQQQLLQHDRNNDKLPLSPPYFTDQDQYRALSDLTLDWTNAANQNEGGNNHYTDESLLHNYSTTAHDRLLLSTTNPSKMDLTMMQRMKQLSDLSFTLDVRESSWWEFYGQLCRYKEKHGHLFVRSTGKYKNLNDWMRRQRILYTRDQLSQEKIQALNDIGFSWAAQKRRWDTKYKELCLFYKENQHTKVPSNNDDYKSLHGWIVRQRKIFSNFANSSENEIENLHGEAKERFDKLNAIGFNWTSNNK